MSEEYTLEEILLTENFSEHIYRWWNENHIVQHSLARADYVRGHNQRIQAIFDDLKELNYLLEEKKYDEAICHYGWMEDEAKEVVSQPILDFLDKIKLEAPVINNDF